MKTIRQQIDELLEKQKWCSLHMDRVSGFDLINTRKQYHTLEQQISKLCKESGERRIP